MNRRMRKPFCLAAQIGSIPNTVGNGVSESITARRCVIARAKHQSSIVIVSFIRLIALRGKTSATNPTQRLIRKVTFRCRKYLCHENFLNLKAVPIVISIRQNLATSISISVN
jgi:hypothetical protein